MDVATLLPRAGGARSDAALQFLWVWRSCAPFDLVHGKLCYASHMSTIRGTTRLDERGRLVLPVELRRRLGLNAGDEVAITEEADGALRIESRLAAARGLIGLAGSLDHSSLDDLRAVRREQALAEDEAARSARVRPAD